MRNRWFVICGFMFLYLLILGACSSVSSNLAPNSGGAGNGGGGNSGGGPTSNSSACSGMSTGQGASLNGFRPFPAANAWNQDISSATLDSNSDAIIRFIGPGIGLHPDFGAGEYQGSTIGIPYVVVDGSQNQVSIDFTAYGNESDPGPMPVPANAWIEGYPNPGNGDRHVLAIDKSNCFLYELYSAYPNSDGSWNAASAAVWDLANGEQRPWTWTSADAAGLPIFPGLIRYDEVAAGKIQHAIRFTLPQSRAAMVPPASHWAANSTDAAAPPMGMRLRLKANFDISHFSKNVQVILAAMKQFGLIMADNGSAMFISGAPDDRWDNNDLHNLSQIPASAFEVLQMNPIYTAANVPQGGAPTINSFTANPAHVSAGGAVTLDWQASNASYYVLSPQVGAVSTTSTKVHPTQTTTYTLYVTNQYGRTTSSLTVSVP